MGGVQESRSWHSYRKKPLTLKKQVDEKERKETHAPKASGRYCRVARLIKPLYLFNQGRYISIKLSNLEQVTLTVLPILLRQSRGNHFPGFEQKAKQII